MQPKPEHFDKRFAESFKDQNVVATYGLRAPYPDEMFDILLSLLAAEPRTVLDVGTGPGTIARALVDRVERVDAVDFSQAMIEKGKSLPHGDHPRLHWIYGRVEEVTLNPPYGLVTAGSSIHWFDWEVVFPRFREVLVPGGYVAIVYPRNLPNPWDNELRQIRARFSVNRGGHLPSRAADEIKARGLLQRVGYKETAPETITQSIDDFIDGLHSRSGCSRERMGAERAEEMDEQVRKVLEKYAQHGKVQFQVVGTVVWGIPLI